MSNQNQTDRAPQTKQCTGCGDVVTRKPKHSDAHWASIRKCSECRKKRYQNSPSKTKHGKTGNEFWATLARGDMPDHLKLAYKKHKKQVRAESDKKRSEYYGRCVLHVPLLGL